MNGRCVSCKHWDRSKEYEAGHSQGLGLCANAKMLWESTEWEEKSDDRVFKESAEGSGAFVQDGSDYWAKLLTRPTFGCTDYLPIES